MTRKRISLNDRRDELLAEQFGHHCPDCGCSDFRKPSGPLDIPGGQRRYAYCRNCGATVKMVEKIELVVEKKSGKKQKV